jgi:3-oxoacyl-[acyl-carrier-protein] synthase II
MDFVPLEARETNVNIAMSNSFGFGGHNSCLVVGKI